MKHAVFGYVYPGLHPYVSTLWAKQLQEGNSPEMECETKFASFEMLVRCLGHVTRILTAC